MSKSAESKAAKYLGIVGLQFHPFDRLEASADPRLLSYNIDHPIIHKAWAGDDCLLVGESGSGRTAIAEKLLYDCRVGKNRSRKFPIRLSGAELTSPEKSIQDLAVYAAAVEMLMQLAYEPWEFEDLEPKGRSALVAAVESAAPGILNHFLPQILQEGSHLPIAKFADPPAETLPIPSDRERVRKMARQMRELNQAEDEAGGSPTSILEIVPGLLGFDEIKLVVDFQTVPSQSRLEELDDFHNRLNRAGKVSRVTLFPLGSNQGGRRYVDGFIIWSKKQLTQVLRARLFWASEGDFDSLSAISDPSISKVEDHVVDAAWGRGSQTPRAVLSLAKTLLELTVESTDRKRLQITKKVFDEAVNKEYSED